MFEKVSANEASYTTFVIFFFFTVVTGLRRFLRLKLGDARIYEPRRQARLGHRSMCVANFVGKRESLLNL